MGFKKSDGPVKYNIDYILGNIKESDTHDWIKCVMRGSWGDNAPTLDIRSVNPKNDFVGKGISLTNEEADRLVNILLENDYGTLEELEKAIKRKRDIFSVTDSVEMMPSNTLDEGDYYVIDINLGDE